MVLRTFSIGVPGFNVPSPPPGPINSFNNNRRVLFNFSEKTMPSWFREIAQQKDETPQTVTSVAQPPALRAIFSAEEPAATASVQNSETKKTVEKESPSSVLSLLRGKDSLQSTILELIQELAKKKQDIQQATLTLIQNQQNSDLLIKVYIVDILIICI